MFYDANLNMDFQGYLHLSILKHAWQLARFIEHIIKLNVHRISLSGLWKYAKKCVSIYVLILYPVNIDVLIRLADVYRLWYSYYEKLQSVCCWVACIYWMSTYVVRAKISSSFAMMSLLPLPLVIFWKIGVNF